MEPAEARGLLGRGRARPGDGEPGLFPGRPECGLHGLVRIPLPRAACTCSGFPHTCRPAPGRGAAPGLPQSSAHPQCTRRGSGRMQTLCEPASDPSCQVSSDAHGRGPLPWAAGRNLTKAPGLGQVISPRASGCSHTRQPFAQDLHPEGSWSEVHLKMQTPSVGSIPPSCYQFSVSNVIQSELCVLPPTIYLGSCKWHLLGESRSPLPFPLSLWPS